MLKFAFFPFRFVFYIDFWYFFCRWTIKHEQTHVFFVFCFVLCIFDSSNKTWPLLFDPFAANKQSHIRKNMNINIPLFAVDELYWWILLQQRSNQQLKTYIYIYIYFTFWFVLCVLLNRTSIIRLSCSSGAIKNYIKIGVFSTFWFVLCLLQDMISIVRLFCGRGATKSEHIYFLLSDLYRVYYKTWHLLFDPLAADEASNNLKLRVFRFWFVRCYLIAEKTKHI